MNNSLHQNSGSLCAKLFNASLLVYAATLPVSYFVINNLAAIALAISWLLLLIQGKVRFPSFRSKYLYIFSSLFLVYAVGALYSTNLKEAMWQLEIMMLLFVLPLILGTVPPISPKRFKQVILVFAASTTLIAILCIIETLLRNYKKGFELAAYNAWYYSSESLVEGFGFHPNYMAIYSLFTIVLLLYLLGSNNRKNIGLNTIVPSIFVIFLHIVFIALLSARTQIIILILLSLLWIGYYAYKYKKVKIGVLLMILCIGMITSSIAVSPILREKFKGLLGVSVDQDNEKFSASLRFQKWNSAYNIFKENPIFGIGTGDMQERLQTEYKKNNYDLAYSLQYTAHNQYLDTAGRLGIIGLISLLACLLYPMYKSFISGDILYLSFLLIISISFIPEMVLTLNKGIAFYAFFNSMLAFHSSRHIRAN